MANNLNNRMWWKLTTQFQLSPWYFRCSYNMVSNFNYSMWWKLRWTSNETCQLYRRVFTKLLKLISQHELFTFKTHPFESEHIQAYNSNRMQGGLSTAFSDKTRKSRGRRSPACYPISDCPPRDFNFWKTLWIIGLNAAINIILALGVFANILYETNRPQICKSLQVAQSCHVRKSVTFVY